MALTTEQWERVGALTTELRSMGCALSIFTPDDVEAMAETQAEADDDGEEVDEAALVPAMTADQSAEWIERNRKYLEDTMSTAGNLFIADNIDQPAIPA